MFIRLNYKIINKKTIIQRSNCVWGHSSQLEGDRKYYLETKKTVFFVLQQKFYIHDQGGKRISSLS